MKFIHSGDLHIGLSTHGKYGTDGINSRTRSIFQRLDELIAYTLKNSYPMILLTGDIFDRLNISDTIQTEFNKRLRLLKEKSVTLVAINGNHDRAKNPQIKSPLSVIDTSNFDNIKILNLLDEYKVGDCKIVGLPWLIKQEMDEYGGDNIVDIVKNILSKIRDKKNTILLGHLTIDGVINNYNSPYIIKDINIPQLLLRDFKYVALGHIHQHINFNDKIVYAGSVEPSSFSEENDEKGFIAYDNGKIEFIKLKSTVFKTIKIDIDKNEKDVQVVILDNLLNLDLPTNSYVKIKLNLHKDKRTQIDEYILKDKFTDYNIVPFEYNWLGDDKVFRNQNITSSLVSTDSTKSLTEFIDMDSIKNRQNFDKNKVLLFHSQVEAELSRSVE